MRKIKVFVSSPGDLTAERGRLQDVAIRLNGDYVGRAQIELFLWEENFYTASKTYQDQIPPTAGSDIVISMFWTRLGRPLGADFRLRRPLRHSFAGELTGSTYELLSALDDVKNDVPAVYVFRKLEKPSFQVSDEGRSDDEDEYVLAREEWRKVGAFFKANFEDSVERGLVPYEPFETTDGFETRVAGLLRDWIETNVVTSSQLLWPAHRGSPFPGLVAYDQSHADVYFGRTQKVANAVRELKDRAKAGFPMLFIIGQSGAGKSSLMRAGLAPRLTTPGAVDGIDIWRTATIRPSGDVSPFHALAKALLGDAEAPAGSPAEEGALPELRKGSFGTVDLLADLLTPGTAASIAPLLSELDKLAAARKQEGRFHRDVGANLLLLVDQFEDVFGESFPTATADFSRFLDLCATSRRIWVVCTLRADLYDRFINDFIVLKAKAASYDLTAPREAELLEIIERSAEAAGLTYETDPATDRRLDEVLFEEARETGSLPLLQFALNRLYKDCVLDGPGAASAAEANAAPEFAARAPRLLTFTAYRALGGIAGAINTAAEEAVANAGSGDEKVLNRAIERLLRLLVIQVVDRRSNTVGREAFAVHPVALASLPSDAGTKRLVSALVEARILVTDGANQGGDADHSSGDVAAAGRGVGATIRIAHEGVLKSWRRAQKFLAAETAYFQIRSDVEIQHRKWRRKKRFGDLIAVGESLNAAVDLKNSYGDDLPEELRAFIGRSVLRRRVRNSLYVAVGAAMGIAAGAAIWFGLEAAESSRQAQRYYGVARDQLDQQSQQVEKQFENRYGVRTETIQVILSVIRDAVEQLSSGNPDPVLRKVRGDMHYRFGRTYRRAGQNDRSGDTTSPAEDNALASLAIRKELAEGAPGNVGLQADLGDAYELMGDVHRDQVFVIRTDEDRTLLQAARVEQETAFGIRNALWQRDPANRRWRLGMSFSHVRLGDLDNAFTFGMAPTDAKPGMEASLDRYLEAAKLAEALSLDFPDDVEVRKEVAFTQQKVGDGHSRLKQWDLARGPYERSACIRTEFFNRETDNAKAKDDLAFILGKVAAIPGLASEYAQALGFRSLAIRRDLYQSDLSNANWTFFLADALASLSSIKTEQETLAAFWFQFESREKLAQLHERYPSERRFENRLKQVEEQLAKLRDKLREQSTQLNENPVFIYDQIAGEQAKYDAVFNAKYAQFFNRRC